MGVNLADIAAQLVELAVHAEPRRKRGLLAKLPSNVAGRQNCAEDAVEGHQTPVLLRAMDHAVDQVAIADAEGRLVGELEALVV